jgi:hypothetical protein
MSGVAARSSSFSSSSSSSSTVVDDPSTLTPAAVKASDQASLAAL